MGYPPNRTPTTSPRPTTTATATANTVAATIPLATTAILPPPPSLPTRYDSVLGYLVGCSILASVPYHIYGIIKYPGREKEVMMADLGISAEQQAQSAHV